MLGYVSYSSVYIAHLIIEKGKKVQRNHWMVRLTHSSLDGWMDDLRFYVLFNSISVISGRCLDDNERLCAMELRLRLRRFHLE